MMQHLRWAALVAFLMLEVQSDTEGATFQGLGDLPGGGSPNVPISANPSVESRAKGVSPNGKIVVGTSVTQNAPPQGTTSAFKWTTGGGMVDLGDHPQAQYYSTAIGALNNDTVVGFGDLPGNFYGQIMQWSSPAGSSAPTTLPMNPPWQRLESYTGDQPVALNASGKTVVVGYVSEIPWWNSEEAMVWVKTSAAPAPAVWSNKRLGFLGPGMSPAPGPSEPPRGTPDIDGYKDYSYAFGINTTATHIVGFSASGEVGNAEDEANPNFRLPQAVMWTDPTGDWASPSAAQSLGFIGGPGSANFSLATDITNDGLTVVGTGCTNNDCSGANPTGQNQAFVGTVGNPNLIALGILPVNDPAVRPSSRAVAIAGNGTTVVGWSTTDVGIVEGEGQDAEPIPITTRTAFIWDPKLTSGQMMNLKTYLVNNQGLGAELAGWTIRDVAGISDDGTVIVGTGVNPQGNYEAFRVTMDVSLGGLDGDFNDDGIVNAADYTVWRNNLGDADENDLHHNGDGNGVGIGDYILWKQHYSQNMLATGGGGLAVPEPATKAILAFGLAGFGSLRRRSW